MSLTQIDVSLRALNDLGTEVDKANRKNCEIIYHPPPWQPLSSVPRVLAVSLAVPSMWTRPGGDPGHRSSTGRVSLGSIQTVTNHLCLVAPW